MTREQAEKLEAECSRIVDPKTDVTAMPYRPMLGWIVRFQTGNIKTTITELMSAQRAVEIHKRSL